MRLSSSRVSQRRTGRAEGLVFKIYTFLQGKNLHTGLSRPGGSVLCRKGCDAPWSAGRAGSAAEPLQRIPSVQPRAKGRGGWFAPSNFLPTILLRHFMPCVVLYYNSNLVKSSPLSKPSNREGN